MSRSLKKVAGGTYAGSHKSIDSTWRADVHSNLRGKVRQHLRMYDDSDETKDIVLPEYKEVCDLWDAPSDGGSHFYGYRNFHHFRMAKKHLPVDTVRQIWIRDFVGK